MAASYHLLQLQSLTASRNPWWP